MRELWASSPDRLAQAAFHDGVSGVSKGSEKGPGLLRECFPSLCCVAFAVETLPLAKARLRGQRVDPLKGGTTLQSGLRARMGRSGAIFIIHMKP